MSEEGLAESLAGETSSEPLLSFTPFAFSSRRARLASRAFRSSSARRRASVAAVPPALVAVGADEDVVFPELEGTGRGDLVPRLPRTRVQPSWSGCSTSPAPGGEVCVATLVDADAVCCVVVDDIPLVSPELATSLSPNDCNSVISWWMLLFCTWSRGRFGLGPAATLA